MKKINITIIGALGRMGQILINRISKNKNLKLYSLTDIRVGQKIKGIKIQNNSLEAFKKTDVIIDFSRPKSSIEILNFAKKLKKKVVIGTTGFTKKDENLIKNYSKKIAIFKSGNMSLGINLLEYITEILTKKISNNYKIGISDNHHKAKIDYPSGTALMLANAVAKGKGKNLDKLKGKACRNWSWPTQRRRSTSSSCISAICPAGPPKLIHPSLHQNRVASDRVGGETGTAAGFEGAWRDGPDTGQVS